MAPELGEKRKMEDTRKVGETAIVKLVTLGSPFLILLTTVPTQA